MGNSFCCIELLNSLKDMSTVNVQENAVGYASLILSDQKLEVTADKLIAIAKAANITLQPIWAQTFERVLKDRSIEELLEAATSGGGGGGGAAPAAELLPLLPLLLRLLPLLRRRV